MFRMWPRSPTTVTSSPSFENVNTGTRCGYARFISPPDRIVAIRAAVLFFSVTMSFRIERPRPHLRALFNGLAVNLAPTRACACAREADRYLAVNSRRDSSGRASQTPSYQAGDGNRNSFRRRANRPRDERPSPAARAARSRSAARRAREARRPPAVPVQELRRAPRVRPRQHEHEVPVLRHGERDRGRGEADSGAQDRGAAGDDRLAAGDGLRHPDAVVQVQELLRHIDRKSTRLNSSHG